MLFNILQSFKKRKKFYFFMIFQLLFCFISLNECFSIINYYNNNIKIVKKIIPTNDTFTIDKRVDAKFQPLDKIDFSKIDNFYKFLNSNTNLTLKGGYLYNSSNVLGIDKYILSYDFFSILEGRKFNTKDFENKNNLPVILGYNFKEKFKLGESINLEGKNYNIVGFLNKNTTFLQEGNSFIEKLKKLDDFFIIPIFYDELGKIDKLTFINSYLFNVEKNDKNTFKNINNKMEELSLEYEIKSFEKIVNDFYGETKGFSKIEMINTFILLIISIFAIVSSALLSIVNRKKEFGVLMALGASKKNIILQVILENILILLGAFIISFIHFCFLGKHLFGGIINVQISLFNIGVTGLLMLILLLFISLSITRKMFKFSLKDLIGGRN